MRTPNVLAPARAAPHKINVRLVPRSRAHPGGVWSGH